MGETYEIEEEAAHPIAAHFKQPISQIEVEKKLAYYFEVMTEISALEATKEQLRKDILELGKGQESLSAGKYAAFFKKVSGRVSCDWQKAYKDAVGEMTEEDARKYIKRGEDTVRVEIKKLG